MWTGRRGLSEMLLEETQVSSLMSESLWPSMAFAQGAWMPLPQCHSGCGWELREIAAGTAWES